ncbi:MAG: C4-dicarboxylate ABC transporter substrate-binding protein, partial [Deltaproteobacteria bacterium]|nr:C4-dicarboxylate ABC transporter substrate-binding protein [Deltaproteobacteria bacterium]
MFRGVQMGQTDIGCVGLAYQPGVFPVSSAVELPLGFDSASVASMVLHDLVQETNPEEFSGVKVLTMFTSAPSNLMTREQITTLDQIKGVEYRASGIASKVLERLGAVPVSMPMPDVPEALQKGLVKGLLTSMEVLKDMNFAEFCPYQTIGNFQVYTFAVIMNLKAWNSLPQDIQKILDDLAPEQALWTGRYMDGHVQNSLAWVHEKYGTSPVTLSAEDMETARQKLSPLVDEWKTMAESKALPSEDILTRIQRLKAKYETELN